MKGHELAQADRTLKRSLELLEQGKRDNIRTHRYLYRAFIKALGYIEQLHWELAKVKFPAPPKPGRLVKLPHYGKVK